MVFAVLISMIPTLSIANVIGFTEDFESMDPANTTAIGDAGWVVYASVFAAGSGNFLYGYGPFPAPNNPAAPAFSNLVSDQGGTEQGAVQLSVFSDYENAAEQNAGNLIESNVFREYTIGAGDVGKTWTFSFQAKMGGLVAPSTAAAFIKTIDPASNYNMTNFVSEDMTNITTEWGGWSISLVIDEGLVDQLFQVGFTNNCTSYAGSSIYYDNLALDFEGGSGIGIQAYSQDFELLNAGSLTALGDEGWLVFGNVFSGSTGDFLYGYGPNPAPNNPVAPAFSAIVGGQGGTEQGTQQLSVFSDYENATAHLAGDLVESTVYLEQSIGTDDIGKTWTFQFQAKKPSLGGVTPPTTAQAFIKTLDPSANYATTNLVAQDMSTISGDWIGYSVSLTIDASLVDQLFQIGFSNTCTSYNPSTIIYDNVVLFQDLSPVPDMGIVMGAQLGQNYPNPFNPETRIDFSLERDEFVNLAVYDIAGRLVVDLVSENRAAGDHFVTWNGLNQNGSAVSSGQYFYVLKTDAGQVSRSMVLLK